MSFTEGLPSECSQHILSYLDLVDCLRFTSTCTAALKEGLPVLCMRRNRMIRPYAVAAMSEKNKIPDTIPYCPSPTSSAVELDCDLILQNSGSIDVTVGLLEDLERDSPELDDVIVLPTVQDRVKELRMLMAPLHSHPLKDAVEELHSSLDVISNESFVGIPLSAPLLLESLRRIMRPMKLQSHILRTVLLSEQDAGSEYLSRYLGDVLCVAYLLFDCDINCSCSEGSPSSFWIGESIRKTPLRYRSWVLMHAGILRTVPLSCREKSRLGIQIIGCSLDDDLTPSTPNSARSIAQVYNRMASAWTIPMEYYRSDKFMNSAMVLVYDDFGPLGPSFRGRDVVRVRDVTAHSMLSCVSSIRRNHQQRHEAIEWLCLAHEQAVQTRPLTVRSPMIRIG